MNTDFADGYCSFEAFINRLMSEKHLTKEDIEEYFKMWSDGYEDY